MKLKYFLRGLGTGIIFCAIVLFAAYMTNKKQPSDDEIIERAKELGMVMDDSKSVKDMLNDTTEDSTDDNSSASSKEETTEATTETTTNATTTEEATTESSSKDTTKDSNTRDDNKVTEIEFTVSSGMSSTSVANILKDMGVISDAHDFDLYLDSNGYSTVIRPGSYKIPSDADYETIAKTITGR